MTLYINVGHCFSDIYGQTVVGHCLSDIYGQVIVVCPLECTGCLKKTWTFFENAITPSFIEETFPNFLWLQQVDTPLQ